MVRTPEGRIKIEGVKINAGRETRRQGRELAEHELQLRRYFPGGLIYPDTGEETNKAFVQKALFVGCVGVVEAPRRRYHETVNLNGPYYVSRTSRSARGSNAFSFRDPISWARRKAEPVIVFKFDEKPFIRGYFFMESKTLIMGTLYAGQQGPAYMRLVMEWLTANGHLTMTEEQDAAVQVEPTMKRGVEIHGGQKVFIQLAIDRRECTVGCDPEFEYLNPQMRPERAPSKFRGTSPDQEIGLDGAGAQIEIRPKAFKKPADVVGYMIGIMQRLRGDARLSCRGEVYPLGGHIHIGVGHSYEPPSDLVYLLDYFLGKPTVNLSGSARLSYKRMGAYETKRWGFEYRTPPAAIFQWPEFARLAMKICKKVTEAYINAQVIVVNPTPQFEDYWNYAGFTPREYDRWTMYLALYREFMANPNGYQQDVIENWLAQDATTAFPRPTAEDLQRQAAAEAARRAEEERRLEEERLIREEQAARRAREQEERVRRQREEEIRREPRRIVFSDDWSDSVQNAVRDTIMAALPEAEFPVVQIRLFGLAGSRGDVTYGYMVSGMESIEGTWEGFGVPYSVRVCGGASEEEANDRAIVHAAAIAVMYRAAAQEAAGVTPRATVVQQVAEALRAVEQPAGTAPEVAQPDAGCERNGDRPDDGAIVEMVEDEPESTRVVAEGSWGNMARVGAVPEGM